MSSLYSTQLGGPSVCTRLSTQYFKTGFFLYCLAIEIVFPHTGVLNRVDTPVLWVDKNKQPARFKDALIEGRLSVKHITVFYCPLHDMPTIGGSDKEKKGSLNNVFFIQIQGW